MKKHIKLMAIIILSSFIFFSCSDDENTNPVDGNNNVAIKGRVTDNSGNAMQKVSSGVEGATVTMAEIKSNGSLETVSDASVQTDANGEFELTLNSEIESKSNLVVMATKGSNQWKAIISSEIKAGQANYSPPVNTETSVETDIYAEVVADNQASLVTYADVAFYVNADIAMHIKSNSSSKTKVKNAIVAEAEARNSTLTNSFYGYTSTDIETAKQVEIEAQKMLENELYFSSDTEASYEMAWEAYFDAIIEGYSNTSISLSHYAESREVSGKAMIEMSADLDAETKLQLEKRNAYLKAKLLTKATVKEYEKADADQEKIKQVEQQNNTLLVSIKSSTSIEAINDAYANYRTAIKANLKTSFEAYAAAFTAIDSALETTIKATLKTTIATATNIQAIIEAYTKFYASINTSVSSELNINNNAYLEAFANIYALIYMHN